MKLCPPVSEKPQMKFSLPSVKTHLSGRAGNFFKSAFRSKLQKFTQFIGGGYTALAFAVRGHSEALHRVCNAIPLTIPFALFAGLVPISKMPALRFVAGCVLSPVTVISQALAPFFCGG